jgi:hypothetical protein
MTSSSSPILYDRLRGDYSIAEQADAEGDRREYARRYRQLMTESAGAPHVG